MTQEIDNFITQLKTRVELIGNDLDSSKSDSINDIRDSEISIYNKYIELLSKEKFDELFDDFEELEELMEDLGIPYSDRYKILEHIDSTNFNTKSYGVSVINLNSKLVLYNNLYLNNKALVEEIDNRLANVNIDLDMIPNIAKKLSNENNYEEVHNIVVTLILNELFKRLIESIDKDDMKNVHELELTINDTLKHAENFDESIINPTRNIILNYEDLLNEEINKGNDINTYMNISLDDLEKTYNSHEKAMSLKILPLVKSMKETLENMKEADKTSDEYIEYMKLLMNLNEAYREIKES